MRIRPIAGIAIAATIIAAAACEAAPTPWSGSNSPFGHVDSATIVGANTALITGWADEADHADPVPVVAFIGGGSVGSDVARHARANVAAQYSRSVDTGFAFSVTGAAVTAGADICVSAVNRNAGSHTVLGCTKIQAANITAVAAGAQHSLALTSGGAVKAWGSNGYGQLGSTTNSGTASANNSPLDVQTLSAGVTSVVAGSRHSIALTNSGAVNAWGANDGGQLGRTANIGTLSPNNEPQVVDGLVP